MVTKEQHISDFRILNLIKNAQHGSHISLNESKKMLGHCVKQK